MMDKRLHESKTFWIAILSLLVAILAMPEFTAIVPLEWLPAIQIGIAGINIALRLITTKPIKGL